MRGFFYKKTLYTKKNGTTVLRIHGIRVKATSPIMIAMIFSFAIVFISSVLTPEIEYPTPKMTKKSTQRIRLIKKMYL
jgi:hypothetical protein